jgi:hypothetical protein
MAMIWQQIRHHGRALSSVPSAKHLRKAGSIKHSKQCKLYAIMVGSALIFGFCSYGSRPNVAKLIDLQSTNITEIEDSGEEDGSEDDESGETRRKKRKLNREQRWEERENEQVCTRKLVLHCLGTYMSNASSASKKNKSKLRLR